MLRAISRALIASLLVSAFQLTSTSVSGAEELPTAGGRILEGLTTATQTVIDNGDGSYTGHFYSGPIRYLNASQEWVPLDLTLRDNGAMIETANARYRVSFSKATEGATLAAPFGALTLVHPEAITGEPAVIDNKVVYEDSLGDDDIVFQPIASGVKDSVVIAASPARSSYAVELRHPETLQAIQGDGFVKLTGSFGVERARYGDGYAFDAAGSESAIDVRLIEAVPGLTRIAVSVSSAWGQSPNRAFPLTLDPVLTVSSGGAGSFDTYVNSDNCLGTYSTQTELRIGSDAVVADACGLGAVAKRRARSFLRFNLDAISEAGVVVTDALLRMYAFSSVDAAAENGRPYIASSLATAPTSATNWNNQPATLAPVNTPLLGGVGWHTWQLMDIANVWVQDRGANTGIGLSAPANELDTFSLKRYRSAEYGSNIPHLEVHFTASPASSLDAYPAPGQCTRLIVSGQDVNACAPGAEELIGTLNVVSLVGMGETSVGTLDNAYIWKYGRVFQYAQCKVDVFILLIMDCVDVGSVIVGAKLRLNGFQALWSQTSGVFEGPNILQGHIWECREDDLVDDSCSETGGQEAESRTYFNRDIFTSLSQSYKRKTDKFFWDFQYEWLAEGWSGKWETPTMTTSKYVCNGLWEEDDPGAPCHFVQPSSDGKSLPGLKIT